MHDDLYTFIRSNPDGRELKRAVAVQMALNGYKHRENKETLGVSSGFISKWTHAYQESGVTGLTLGYVGSIGYLSPEQRACIIAWLKRQNTWNLAELRTYIEQTYAVVFESKQSYYTLFKQAGINWKKTQKRNPNADPVLVQKKIRD